MRSLITPSFRKRFAQLSPEMRRLIRKNYELWKKNPFHNSLEFKKLHAANPHFWSARCGLDFRVVGRMQDDAIYWFFVGSHAEYDRLCSNL